MTIDREIASHFLTLVNQYNAVTLTGPRQSGKTTLCKMLMPDAVYKNLEDPDVRMQAEHDPRSFLDEGSRTQIIDEIQRCPALFSYLQGILDTSPSPGKFVLTGSAQFELLDIISQSLAGRTALLKLLPFTVQEAYGDNTYPPIATLLRTGFYPRIFNQRLDPTEAFSFYYSTYIERDVRSLLNIRDLFTFDRFVRLCTARTGHILNAQSLANECGINQGTATNWFSVLEASYILFRLPPHFNNLNKRIVKSPKIYVLDPGLACYLMGLTEPKQIDISPYIGNLFETFVISELLKYRYNSGKESNLYFWRDNTGHEIDLILDFGTDLLPIEIKSGKTVASDFTKNISFYRKINPSCTKAVVIYGGDRSWREHDTYFISWHDLHVLKDLTWELKIEL